MNQGFFEQTLPDRLARPPPEPTCYQRFRKKKGNGAQLRLDKRVPPSRLRHRLARSR
jgi:hypothetical protein